jgi:DNA-binding CsgD family transcriptional regulator
MTFLEHMGDVRDVSEFSSTLISGLSDVIAADYVSYNEVDPVRKSTVIVSEPVIFGGAEAILEQHMDDNPIVRHNAGPGDGQAVMWSDFISQRQLHATALWDELFRPLSIERQMVATLPATRPLLIGVVLMRTGRDFSERERSVLNLLRPHLRLAFRNAEARSLAGAMSTLASGGGGALILVSRLGAPLAATREASELVRAFGDSDTGELPARLLEWYLRVRRDEPLPAEPLMSVRGDDVVEARLISSSMIVLRQLSGKVASVTLLRLGLGARERDVLALVSEGLTNRAIAARIGVESGTVKKHLDNIYEKLGVHSRTAAAAIALRESRRAHPQIPIAFTELLGEGPGPPFGDSPDG